MRRAERPLENNGKKWKRGTNDQKWGRQRQTDHSELFNLIFPTVPDISMHHELVLPIRGETTGSNQ